MLESPAFIAILLTALAGGSAFLGAYLACRDEAAGGVVSDKVKRGITAFGGGALIGAVGLLLVPHGLESQPIWLAAVSFLVGGAIAMLLDRWLKKSGTPVAQLVALNLDFIPEAMVVGAVITEEFGTALFLAVVMVAQNLPEGFNAYREVRSSHESFIRRHILQLMSMCLVIGPVAAMIGYGAFTIDSAALGTIMTFFAGGILYLVFKDIAPEADKEGDFGPTFGAVLGFSVALVGSGITG